MNDRADADDLAVLLIEHRSWLNSEEKAGKRAHLNGLILVGARLRGSDLRRAVIGQADLRGAELDESDFRGADMSGARLSGASLRRVDLRQAILQGADLTAADLTGATLQGADVTGACFRDVTLQDVDLTESRGLLEIQLGGAILSGARLPDRVSGFSGLANIVEASHNASAILFSLLLGCLYTWLTVGATTDARLLTNSDSSPLPIIGTPILIAGFYWIAPILLLGLFLYFHLGLQRLWEGLAGLPAIFPDGRPVYQQIYPWLFSGLVCAHFQRLRRQRPPLSRLQNGVTALLAWWIVPLTLLLLWARYLPRHDWSGTGVHVVATTIAAGFGLLSEHLARAALRGEMDTVSATAKGPRARLRGSVVVALPTSLFAIALCVASYGAIEGVREEPGSIIQASAIQKLVPSAFAFFGYSTFASLQQAEVASKPDGWMGQTDEDLSRVKRARLEGRNLRFAEAAQAFLVNADLRFADMRGADLWGADLRAAEIRGADLREAHLSGARLGNAKLLTANLQGAHLGGSNLDSADLSLANLRGADLVAASLRHADLGAAELQTAVLAGADLRGANLAAARLTGASLAEANIRGAIFYGALGLDAEQVTSANDWRRAFYSDDLLRVLDLPPDHNKMVASSLAAESD